MKIYLILRLMSTLLANIMNNEILAKEDDNFVENHKYLTMNVIPSTSYLLYLNRKTCNCHCNNVDSHSNESNLWKSLVINMKLNNSLQVHLQCRKSIYSRRKLLNEVIADGLMKVVSNGLLRSLLDMLRFWEINKKRVIVLQSDWGFNENDVYSYYKRNNLVIHKIITVTKDNLMSRSWLNLLLDYRFIILVTSESVAETIMMSANQPDAFKSFRNWIILSNNIPKMFNSPNMMNFIDPLLSQVTVLAPRYNKSVDNETESCDKGTSCFNPQSVNEAEWLCKTTDEIQMYDVFYSHSYKTVEHINFAKWTHSNGLFYYEYDYLPLRGRYVRISVMETVPYVMYEYNRTEFQRVGGILFNYHESMEKQWDPIHKYCIITEESYGISDNGSFSGVVGHLHRGESDVGVAAHGHSEVRKRAVHYMHMCCYGFMQMVIPRPSSQFPPTIYVLPFTFNVWIVILIALVTISVIIVINLSTNPDNEDFQNEIKSSKKFLFWLLSGQFLDDALDAPPGLSAKIISYTLITATTMTFVYYTSVFTSFLTYKELKLPFTNIEEMVTNYDYEVLIVKGGKHQHYFQNADDGSFKKVWDKLIREEKRGLSKTYKGAYYHMLAGKYILFMDGHIAQYYAKTSGCAAYCITGKYMKEYYHELVRKDFPYQKLYSRSLLKIWEGGVASRWVKSMLTYDSKICDDPNVSQTLGLMQVFTLFVFLLIGYSFACLVLIFEIIYCCLYSYRAN